MMQVKINQIARRAKQDKQLKFTSLVHHVNEANLAECYQELKRNKACGIDCETVESYGENLEGVRWKNTQKCGFKFVNSLSLYGL